MVVSSGAGQQGALDPEESLPAFGLKYSSVVGAAAPHMGRIT
jgi:hypothetical protein